MIRFGRLIRQLTGVIGSAFLAGCYSYFPVNQPSPGSTVRIHVPVTSALQNPNARPENVEVEGLLLSSGDSLVLEAKTRRQVGAVREVLEIDTFRVARTAVSGVEERVLSKPKSVAMGVLVTAGAAVLTVGLIKAAGGMKGDGGPGNGGPGAQIRVKPVFDGLFHLIGR